MSYPAQTQRDLDPIGCDTPNCNHDHSIIWMRQKCHPKAHLQVAYHKALGAMVVSCPSCGAEVGRIAVARSRLIAA
jgi:ribosomal protein S27E